MHCLTILSLILAGCTASAPPEAEPKAGTAVVEDPSGPAFTGPPAPEPLDPCAAGLPLITDGVAVIAPVPCAGFYIDKGDPPPDAIGRPSLDPPDVARPVPEAAFERR